MKNFRVSFCVGTDERFSETVEASCEIIALAIVLGKLKRTGWCEAHIDQVQIRLA